LILEMMTLTQDLTFHLRKVIFVCRNKYELT
jgi:hypothetical protein